MDRLGRYSLITGLVIHKEMPKVLTALYAVVLGITRVSIADLLIVVRVHRLIEVTMSVFDF